MDIKKSRFTEEQIIGFLKHAEAGMPIKEQCRNGGFSDATFYTSGAPRSAKHPLTFTSRQRVCSRRIRRCGPLL